MKRLHRYAPRNLGRGIVLALVVLAITCLPASAQEGELQYTISPVGGYLFESDNSALDGTFFYGGELGLGFGQFLQLSGEFVLRNSVDTDFADFDGLAGLDEPTTDFRRYGGRLRLNVPVGTVVPFVSIGTGVLAFDPEGFSSSRSIYALPGVGVGFEPIEGARLSVTGELLAYRYNPASVFLGDDAPAAIGEETVYSPSVRAALEFLISGPSPGTTTAVDASMRQQFGSGLSGMEVFVTPFYGRMAFNDALGFPQDQNFAGANLGFHFGPYVGLRGFYARGATGDDVFDEFAGGFQDIQMYGGELKLHLTPRGSGGIVPYGLLGGGYLDVLGGYTGDIPAGATAPEDRYFATAGGGVEVPLTSWLGLVGDVRGAFMSGQDLEDVSSPDEVYGSLLYTAGLTFSLGGGRDAPAPTADRPVPVAPDTADGEAPAAARDTAAAGPPEAADEALRTQVDSLQRQITDLQRTVERQREAIEADTAAVAADGDLTARIDSLARALDEQQQRVEQQVRQQVQQRMRDVDADTVQVDTTQQLTEDEVERIAARAAREADGTGAQRVIEQLRNEVNTLEEEVQALRQQVQQQPDAETEEVPEPDVAPVPEDDEDETVVDEAQDEREPFYRNVFGQPLQAVYPMLGVRAGEGPTHTTVGLRADYRRNPDSRFLLLPEAYLGFGEGATSVGVLANVAYRLLSTEAEEATGLPLEPYIGAGLGLASPTGLDVEFVTNLMIGTGYRIGDTGTFFVEYSTLNGFDFNRFGLGYRIRL